MLNWADEEEASRNAMATRNAEPKPPEVAATATPPAVVVCVEPVSVNLIDAARLTGYPVWTLREAVLSGELHAKTGGRAHVVLLSELRRWVVSLDDVQPSRSASIVARTGHAA